MTEKELRKNVALICAYYYYFQVRGFADGRTTESFPFLIASRTNQKIRGDYRNAIEFFGGDREMLAEYLPEYRVKEFSRDELLDFFPVFEKFLEEAEELDK